MYLDRLGEKATDEGTPFVLIFALSLCALGVGDGLQELNHLRDGRIPESCEVGVENGT